MAETRQDEQGYNGWTNRETWCVNLWLSNDEGLYNATLELVRDAVAGHDEDSNATPAWTVADTLKDFVEELPEVTRVTETASMVSDLLGASMAKVDWYEIANAWLSDVEQDA